MNIEAKKLHNFDFRSVQCNLSHNIRHCEGIFLFLLCFPQTSIDANKSEFHSIWFRVEHICGLRYKQARHRKGDQVFKEIWIFFKLTYKCTNNILNQIDLQGRKFLTIFWKGSNIQPWIFWKQTTRQTIFPFHMVQFYYRTTLQTQNHLLCQ